MNKLPANILTTDEVLHYGPLGGVEGITPSIARQMQGDIIGALAEAKLEEELLDEMGTEYDVLEGELSASEHELEVTRKKLKEITHAVHLTLIKFPNLKNQMPELAEAYDLYGEL